MSFDLLAPHYLWMEAVLAGEKLQRCRVHWLDSVQHCRRALLVGEGNGRFLAECAKRLPQTELTVIDASAKMLAAAERRWVKANRFASEGRVTQAPKFIQATLPTLKLSQTYDLIVTNCFLDCFDTKQLPQVIAEIANHASHDATWLVTDFNIPQSGWPKWRARAVLRFAYTFFRITTGIQANKICPPDEFLRNSGFELKNRIEADAGLIYSAMWQRTRNPNLATHRAARHHDNMGKPCALPTEGVVLLV